MSIRYIKAMHREIGVRTWQAVIPSWLLKYLRENDWVILKIEFKKDD